MALASEIEKRDEDLRKVGDSRWWRQRAGWGAVALTRGRGRGQAFEVFDNGKGQGQVDVASLKHALTTLGDKLTLQVRCGSP